MTRVRVKEAQKRTKRFTFALTPNLYGRFLAAAERHDITVADALREALAFWVDADCPSCAGWGTVAWVTLVHEGKITKVRSCRRCNAIIVPT